MDSDRTFLLWANSIWNQALSQGNGVNTAIPSPKELQATQGTIEASLARIQGIRASQVSFMDSPMGTTAVLTGTATSERERRVATQLLLLEPGINRVENLLEIR